MFKLLTRLWLTLILCLTTVAFHVDVARADGARDSYVTAAPDSDGSVTVAAGVTDGPGSGSTASTSSSSLRCTDTPLDPANVALLGPGGPTAGNWIVPYCTGGGYINPERPIWVTDFTPRASASPATVARQAVAHLPLPSGTIRMSPDATHPQVVNERTWLWIDPTVWHSVSATASVGAVSATATAKPSQVIWNLGDGDRVVCDGPGVPYDQSRPESEQDTSCTYVWPGSSTTEPGGTFTVSATIVWQVSWTAVGALGGGSLGSLNSPPSQAAVRVTEDDALNTAP